LLHQGHPIGFPWGGLQMPCGPGKVTQRSLAFCPAAPGAGVFDFGAEEFATTTIAGASGLFGLPPTVANLAAILLGPGAAPTSVLRDIGVCWQGQKHSITLAQAAVTLQCRARATA